MKKGQYKHNTAEVPSEKTALQPIHETEETADGKIHKEE